ncbi:hypothetical protein [Nocardia sp. XZ_19_369]|uniref:hypothetical protein n=1 Tax=Nocardia sp. XZ_19_369 TaxID=2769487 RepID=UPI00188FC1C3|nr:hypothetical protein [Nocardia sp. XZ_19_369]
MTPGADGELPEFGWFAVTGYAAADALEVTLTSSVDTVTEPVGDGGLVFVLVRTRVVAPSAGERPSFEKPQIAVSTQDGRRVSMRP